MEPGPKAACWTGASPLLDALKAADIIVDLTHTTDQAFWEILDYYDGPVAASHHNCRALTPGQRQLTDDMIRAIVARGGVIGAAFDAWMLDPHWRRDIPCYDQTTQATLETVVDHIDHVCQLAGNANHAGIGSDLDGGFGQEQSPRDLNTIADLQNLLPIFERHGYAPSRYCEGLVRELGATAEIRVGDVREQRQDARCDPRRGTQAERVGYFNRYGASVSCGVYDHKRRTCRGDAPVLAQRYENCGSGKASRHFVLCF